MSVLVQQIQEGNVTAFKKLYEEWAERLFFYFLKKVENREDDAADLVQQTFIRFWQYRATLTEEHFPEAALFQNARMVFIDWLRKEATRRKTLKAAEDQYPFRIAEDTDAYANERLHRALRSLPPMRQKVIRLSHLEGHSYKEIANMMHLSVKTVDNHIRQGLKQLRKILIPIFLLFF